MTFTVEAVNISAAKGTAKTQVQEIELLPGHGISGDAHAGPWHRQVSLLAAEAIDVMKAKGLKLEPGAFGENVVTRGFDWTKAEIGGRVTIGAVELEISQIGKECHSHCAIFYAAGECIMPSQGVFARVLKGGIIRASHRGHYHLR